MVKKVCKLSAQWCMPCKTYAKTFHKVADLDEFKDIEFKDYDVEEDAEGNEYADKYGIRSIPTTLILDGDDTLLKMVSGNIREAELTKIIRENM